MLRVRAVAALEPMPTEAVNLPNLTLGRFWQLRFVAIVNSFLRCLRQLKAGDTHVKAKIVQKLEFLVQKSDVPRRVFRKPIVRNHVRSALCLGQVLDKDARHSGHAFGHRRDEPPVSCDDIFILVDQERIDETELPKRTSQLHDLLVAVLPGVMFVRLDLHCWNNFELIGDLYVVLQK